MKAGQPRSSHKALRVEGDVVVIDNEYAEGGESRYSTTTGRRVDDNDISLQWDFWRLAK